MISYLKSGFELMDSDKKGYLNLQDIKKLNKVLKMQFSDDDLEGLLEIASKNNQQLTFVNFVKFLTTETETKLKEL